MGLSLGGSSGSTKSTTDSSASSQNTYSPGQTFLQQALTSLLSSIVPSLGTGTLSPTTTAQETSSADQINRTAKAGATGLQNSLAARGLGQSGQSGDVSLQTELAREGAQGSNIANFSAVQSQQNNSTLIDALQAAYTALGSSGTGSTSGSSSGSSGGFAVSLNPFKLLSSSGNSGGSGSGGCWIAEAIYGVHDVRTHLVRAWLNGPFRQTVSGRVIMALYLRFGRRVASAVKRSSLLRRTFKPLFDLALGKALDEVRVILHAA
jgi:hypothetical protein